MFIKIHISKIGLFCHARISAQQSKISFFSGMNPRSLSGKWGEGKEGKPERRPGKGWREREKSKGNG